MPTTPNYGWPTPVSSDPSNVPLHMQNAMNAADATVKAHADATTAHGRNNAGPNPSQSVESTTQNIDNTGSYSATAVTSGTPLPVCGFVFTAPATGIGFMQVTGDLEGWVGGNLVILSWELREGGTLGSGSVVSTPHSDRAIGTSPVTVAGVASRFMGGGGLYRVAGLTPSAQYNVRTMHICTPAGHGTIRNRAVLWVPWLR